MKLSLSLIAWLFTISMFSQYSINGKVVDQSNNATITFANIYLPQLEKGTTTNDQGEFQFSNLPKGPITLVVSYLGFETQSLTLDLSNNEDLTIALKPQALEMSTIVISTPFHKLQSENVMKVENKSLSDLKANGAISLSSGLSQIPGVSNITTGSSIGKPVIRGLSGNRVLVYSQGIRLENQQFGDEHGLGLNDAGIETVEVIKGPASLLYGSDALGGVIYLVPERFANQNETNADFNLDYFSNTNGFSTNAGVQTSGEKFRFTFRGDHTEHSDYKTKDYRVTNSRYLENDFKAAIGYQEKNFNTSFRYNLNDSKIGIPEEIGEQNTNKTPLEPFQKITNHMFSSKSKWFFDTSSLDLTLGYTINDRKEFEDHHHEEEHDDHDEDEHDEHDEDEHEDDLEEEFPALHMKLHTFSYDLKYTLPEYGKFETIIGIQGLTQKNTNYGEELLIPNATTSDFGLMATSHVHFSKVDLQLGLRFDTRTIDAQSLLKKSYNSFNAAAGIRTKLAKKVTMRINLASGFRAPNLAELTSEGSHEGANRYEVGNPNLDSEQNFQTDIALEFGNEHIEIFANGFYNYVNDYIFLLPDGTFINEDPVYNYTQEDAYLYGGEFGIHFHPHPLDWLHFESSFETVTGKLKSNGYLPLIPANNLLNTISAEFKTNWLKDGNIFTTLQSTFSQNNVSTEETSSDSYNLLSAGVNGTIQVFKRDFRLSITGTNITNTTYTNHLSRLKPDNIYDMGASWNFSLTYFL